MISGDQIGQLFSNPETVGELPILEIKALCEKYSYCSSVQTLYLKALALHNSLEFEDQLKKVSISVPDRERLFEVIHSKGNTFQEAEEIESSEINPEHFPLEEIQTESNTPTLPQEEEEDTEERTEEFVLAKEDEPLQETILETEIIAAAFDNSYLDLIGEARTDIDQEVNDNIGTDKIEKEVIPTEALHQNEETEIKENLTGKAFNERQELTVEETAIISVSEEENEPLSFIQWLKLKKENTQKGTPEDSSTYEPSENEKGTSTVLSEPLSEREESKKKTDALLEKFMEEEPSISRPTKEFFNPVTNAKRSIEESTDDVMTETLAKIYVLQKNYSKAISAYEQLILLNPEKKTFFASQIKKLKEKLN